MQPRQKPATPLNQKRSLHFPESRESGDCDNEIINNNTPPDLSRPRKKLQTPGKREGKNEPMRYLPGRSPACIVSGLQRTRDLCIAPISLPSRISARENGFALLVFVLVCNASCDIACIHACSDRTVKARQFRIVLPCISQLFLTAVLAHPASRLSAINVDRRLLLLLRLLSVDDALLDIACEAEEGLLDIDVRFRANFHEWDAKLVGKCLALFGRDRTFLFPVAFVANEDFVDAFGRVLLNVGEPGADVYKMETYG